MHLHMVVPPIDLLSVGEQTERLQPCHRAPLNSVFIRNEPSTQVGSSGNFREAASIADVVLPLQQVTIRSPRIMNEQRQPLWIIRITGHPLIPTHTDKQKLAKHRLQ